MSLRNMWLRQHASKFKHSIYPFGKRRVCEIPDWDSSSHLAKSVRRQAVPEHVDHATNCPLCLDRLHGSTAEAVLHPYEALKNLKFTIKQDELQAIGRALRAPAPLLKVENLEDTLSKVTFTISHSKKKP